MGFRWDEFKMKIAKCKSQNGIAGAGFPMVGFVSDHFAFFILHFAFCHEE